MIALLLSFAPALALALALTARRFPGEGRLAALAERRRRARPARVAARRQGPAGGRRRLTLAPRGTALIARALAERPPPPLTV